MMSAKISSDDLLKAIGLADGRELDSDTTVSLYAAIYERDALAKQVNELEARINAAVDDTPAFDGGEPEGVRQALDDTREELLRFARDDLELAVESWDEGRLVEEPTIRELIEDALEMLQEAKVPTLHKRGARPGRRTHAFGGVA